MQIAYLILTHKNPEQLKRLILKLNNDQASFFVHLDAKEKNAAEYAHALNGMRTLQFVSKRIAVNWGAFSMVEATLAGLQEIVDTGRSYDYVVLMSGQDYPIKSNQQILHYFAANNGKEFIHFRSFPTYDLPQEGLDRIEFYYDYDNVHSPYFSTNANIFEHVMRERGIKRKFIAGMAPYNGSQWWSLTYGCIKYILNFINKNPEMENFYRYSKFADEQFFQTIVMNSPFSLNVLNGSLWYIDWSNNNWRNIDWVVSVPHPKTLDMGDFPKLAASNCLYARKFDMAAEKGILDLIDSKLFK